jgi:hypothetical protein
MNTIACALPASSQGLCRPCGRRTRTAVRHWRRGLLFLTGLLAAASATAEDPHRWSPLVQPATQERHVGKVVFVELVTPDVAAAQRFYGVVFGWTFHDVRAGTQPACRAFQARISMASIVQKPLRDGERQHPA